MYMCMFPIQCKPARARIKYTLLIGIRPLLLHLQVIESCVSLLKSCPTGFLVYRHSPQATKRLGMDQ